jgi:hypothetical protein
MAEARLQATDDLGFEAAHMIRRFLSQPTMEFFRQAKANNPNVSTAVPSGQGQ